MALHPNFSCFETQESDKRKTFNVSPGTTHIPYLDEASQIQIVVAGGQGLHSMVVPSFGISHFVLEKIV